MRDINRLYDFYNKLREIHKKVPDWRFGQFILNFMSWYYNRYHIDIFYVEETEILSAIEEFINEILEDKY